MHTVAGQKLHSTDDELYESGAVKALKKEVRKLREQLKVMTVCPATATTEWPTHQQTPVRRASEDSCCRCAEDGCVATWTHRRLSKSSLKRSAKAETAGEDQGEEMRSPA